MGRIALVKCILVVALLSLTTASRQPTDDELLQMLDTLAVGTYMSAYLAPVPDRRYWKRDNPEIKEWVKKLSADANWNPGNQLISQSVSPDGLKLTCYATPNIHSAGTLAQNEKQDLIIKVLEKYTEDCRKRHALEYDASLEFNKLAAGFKGEALKGGSISWKCFEVAGGGVNHQFLIGLAEDVEMLKAIANPPPPSVSTTKRTPPKGETPPNSDNQPPDSSTQGSQKSRARISKSFEYSNPTTDSGTVTILARLNALQKAVGDAKTYINFEKIDYTCQEIAQRALLDVGDGSPNECERITKGFMKLVRLQTLKFRPDKADILIKENMSSELLNELTDESAFSIGLAWIITTTTMPSHFNSSTQESQCEYFVVINRGTDPEFKSAVLASITQVLNIDCSYFDFRTQEKADEMAKQHSTNEIKGIALSGAGALDDSESIDQSYLTVTRRTILVRGAAPICHRELQIEGKSIGDTIKDEFWIAQQPNIVAIGIGQISDAWLPTPKAKSPYPKRKSTGNSQSASTSAPVSSHSKMYGFAVSILEVTFKSQSSDVISSLIEFVRNRLGLILEPLETEAKQAQAVAEHKALRRALSKDSNKNLEIFKDPYHITFSLGVFYTRDEPTPEELQAEITKVMNEIEKLATGVLEIGITIASEIQETRSTGTPIKVAHESPSEKKSAGTVTTRKSIARYTVITLRTGTTGNLRNLIYSLFLTQQFAEHIPEAVITNSANNVNAKHWGNAVANSTVRQLFGSGGYNGTEIQMKEIGGTTILIFPRYNPTEQESTALPPLFIELMTKFFSADSVLKIKEIGVGCIEKCIQNSKKAATNTKCGSGSFGQIVITLNKDWSLRSDFNSTATKLGFPEAQIVVEATREAYIAGESYEKLEPGQLVSVNGLDRTLLSYLNNRNWVEQFFEDATVQKILKMGTTNLGFYEVPSASVGKLVGNKNHALIMIIVVFNTKPNYRAGFKHEKFTKRRLLNNIFSSFKLENDKIRILEAFEVMSSVFPGTKVKWDTIHEGAQTEAEAAAKEFSNRAETSTFHVDINKKFPFVYITLDSIEVAKDEKVKNAIKLCISKLNAQQKEDIFEQLLLDAEVNAGISWRLFEKILDDESISPINCQFVIVIYASTRANFIRDCLKKLTTHFHLELLIQEPETQRLANDAALTAFRKNLQSSANAPTVASPPIVDGVPLEAVETKQDSDRSAEGDVSPGLQSNVEKNKNPYLPTQIEANNVQRIPWITTIQTFSVDDILTTNFDEAVSNLVKEENIVSIGIGGIGKLVLPLDEISSSGSNTRNVNIRPSTPPHENPPLSKSAKQFVVFSLVVLYATRTHPDLADFWRREVAGFMKNYSSHLFDNPNSLAQSHAEHRGTRKALSANGNLLVESSELETSISLPVFSASKLDVTEKLKREINASSDLIIKQNVGIREIGVAIVFEFSKDGIAYKDDQVVPTYVVLIFRFGTSPRWIDYINPIISSYGFNQDNSESNPYNKNDWPKRLATFRSLQLAQGKGHERPLEIAQLPGAIILTFQKFDVPLNWSTATKTIGIHLQSCVAEVKKYIENFKTCETRIGFIENGPDTSSGVENIMLDTTSTLPNNPSAGYFGQLVISISTGCLTAKDCRYMVPTLDSAKNLGILLLESKLKQVFDTVVAEYYPIPQLGSEPTIFAMHNGQDIKNEFPGEARDVNGCKMWLFKFPYKSGSEEEAAAAGVKDGQFKKLLEQVCKGPIDFGMYIVPQSKIPLVTPLAKTAGIHKMSLVVAVRERNKEILQIKPKPIDKNQTKKLPAKIDISVYSDTYSPIGRKQVLGLLRIIGESISQLHTCSTIDDMAQGFAESKIRNIKEWPSTLTSNDFPDFIFSGSIPINEAYDQNINISNEQLNDHLSSWLVSNQGLIKQMVFNHVVSFGIAWKISNPDPNSSQKVLQFLIYTYAGTPQALRSFVYKLLSKHIDCSFFDFETQLLADLAAKTGQELTSELEVPHGLKPPRVLGVFESSGPLQDNDLEKKIIDMFMRNTDKNKIFYESQTVESVQTKETEATKHNSGPVRDFIKPVAIGVGFIKVANSSPPAAPSLRTSVDGSGSGENSAISYSVSIAVLDAAVTDAAGIIFGADIVEKNTGLRVVGKQTIQATDLSAYWATRMSLARELDSKTFQVKTQSFSTTFLLPAIGAKDVNELTEKLKQRVVTDEARIRGSAWGLQNFGFASVLAAPAKPGELAMYHSAITIMTDTLESDTKIALSAFNKVGSHLMNDVKKDWLVERLVNYKILKVMQEEISPNVEQYDLPDALVAKLPVLLNVKTPAELQTLLEDKFKKFVKSVGNPGGGFTAVAIAVRGGFAHKRVEKSKFNKSSSTPAVAGTTADPNLMTGGNFTMKKIQSLPHIPEAKIDSDTNKDKKKANGKTIDDTTSMSTNTTPKDEKNRPNVDQKILEKASPPSAIKSELKENEELFGEGYFCQVVIALRKKAEQNKIGIADFEEAFKDIYPQVTWTVELMIAVHVHQKEIFKINIGERKKLNDDLDCLWIKVSAAEKLDKANWINILHKSLAPHLFGTSTEVGFLLLPPENFHKSSKLLFVLKNLKFFKTAPNYFQRPQVLATTEEASKQKEDDTSTGSGGSEKVTPVLQSHSSTSPQPTLQPQSGEGSAPTTTLGSANIDHTLVETRPQATDLQPPGGAPPEVQDDPRLAIIDEEGILILLKVLSMLTGKNAKELEDPLSQMRAAAMFGHPEFTQAGELKENQFSLKIRSDEILLAGLDDVPGTFEWFLRTLNLPTPGDHHVTANGNDITPTQNNFTAFCGKLTGAGITRKIIVNPSYGESNGNKYLCQFALVLNTAPRTELTLRTAGTEALLEILENHPTTEFLNKENESVTETELIQRRAEEIGAQWVHKPNGFQSKLEENMDRDELALIYEIHSSQARLPSTPELKAVIQDARPGIEANFWGTRKFGLAVVANDNVCNSDEPNNPTEPDVKRVTAYLVLTLQTDWRKAVMDVVSDCNKIHIREDPWTEVLAKYKVTWAFHENKGQLNRETDILTGSVVFASSWIWQEITDPAAQEVFKSELTVFLTDFAFKNPQTMMMKLGVAFVEGKEAKPSDSDTEPGVPDSYYCRIIVAYQLENEFMTIFDEGAQKCGKEAKLDGQLMYDVFQNQARLVPLEDNKLTCFLDLNNISGLRVTITGSTAEKALASWLKDDDGKQLFDHVIGTTKIGLHVVPTQNTLENSGEQNKAQMQQFNFLALFSGNEYGCNRNTTEIVENPGESRLQTDEAAGKSTPDRSPRLEIFISPSSPPLSPLAPSPSQGEPMSVPITSKYSNSKHETLAGRMIDGASTPNSAMYNEFIIPGESDADLITTATGFLNEILARNTNGVQVTFNNLQKDLVRNFPDESADTFAGYDVIQGTYISTHILAQDLIITLLKKFEKDGKLGWFRDKAQGESVWVLFLCRSQVVSGGNRKVSFKILVKAKAQSPKLDRRTAHPDRGHAMK